MSGNTVNVPLVMNDLQKFYLSGAINGNINVNLGDPINDSIYLSVTRSYSYNDTCYTFLSKIQKYLSCQHIVYDTTNYTNPIKVNNIVSRNHAINAIANKSISKYVTSYNLNGAEIFYNSNVN